MTHDLPNTVTEAQMRLREAMHCSTDPQWIERQLSPPPRRRRLTYCILATCALGLAGIVFGAVYARAAERGRPHEITLLLPPDADRINIITISGRYTDRDACERAKLRLVVMAKGAKVVCYPAEGSR